MRQNYYLTIDGIHGPSTNPQYPNAVEVSSFSFGNSIRSTFATTRPKSKALFQDIHFTMVNNSASLQFFNAAVEGAHFTKATLVVVKTPDEGSSKQSESYKITLSEVVVSSFQSGDRLCDREPINQFSLTFAEFETALGVAPSPQTTVRPAHRHLIERLKFLTQHRPHKPGGKT